MKTELEKCMDGEWYECHASVFLEFKENTRKLLAQYNILPYNYKAGKHRILKDLFGSVGRNVSVGNPFICDYGRNIHIGNNVSVNRYKIQITIGQNIKIVT